MGRTLTAARAQVQSGREGAYLGLLAERRRVAESAGGHFWVFRDRASPGTFLEFSESPGGTPVPSPPALAAELAALARYEPGATDIWDEVPLS